MSHMGISHGNLSLYYIYIPLVLILFLTIIDVGEKIFEER